MVVRLGRRQWRCGDGGAAMAAQRWRRGNGGGKGRGEAMAARRWRGRGKGRGDDVDGRGRRREEEKTASGAVWGRNLASTRCEGSGLCVKSPFSGDTA